MSLDSDWTYKKEHSVFTLSVSNTYLRTYNDGFKIELGKIRAIGMQSQSLHKVFKVRGCNVKL